MPHDPIDDEKKHYTLEEFIAVAKEELDSYQKEWSGTKANLYHRQSHTWQEWWETFHRYMSW